MVRALAQSPARAFGALAGHLSGDDARRAGSAPDEIDELRCIVAKAGSQLEHRVAGHTEDGLAIQVISLGNPSLDVPAVGFFAGVHGLERIGVRVLTTYLRSLVERLAWDATLQRQLETVRLVFMPLVNPGGLRRGTRANPRGVDLMRNAPHDADDSVPWLIGGHRISAALPWYRGRVGATMEAEGLALCETVERELLARSFSVALDCHSGFGAVDRIWFPYAHTRRPIEHLAELQALSAIFAASHAYHRYVIEPQSRQYLAHGDLWDHLYTRGLSRPGHRVFLPLTLEMGSWIWIRKNPRQLLSRQGMFNPLIEHREHRVLRRHVAWLDFLTRAAASYRQWLPNGADRERHLCDARARWYGGGGPR
jgi:Zinc carboxypeptidase